MKEEENDLNDEQIAVEESKIMIDFEAVKNFVKKEIKEEDNSIDEVETIEDFAITIAKDQKLYVS